MPVTDAQSGRMRHSIAALLFVLATAAVAISGCSVGGAPSDPVSGPATASPATVATATAPSSASATPAVLFTLTPATVPAPQFTGNGVFSFDTHQPLVVGAGFQALEKMVPTEQWYAGALDITSCSSTDPNATCTTTTPPSTDATCVDGATSIGANQDSPAVEFGANSVAVPLTCTFVFSDTYGHSAPFTVTDVPTTTFSTPTPFPATAGAGDIAFQPSSYIIITPTTQNFPVTITESDYAGQFSVVACSSDPLATCGYNLFEGQPCANPENGLSLFTGVDSTLTNFFYISGGGGAGTANLACTFTFVDQFGNAAALTVLVVPLGAGGASSLDLAHRAR